MGTGGEERNWKLPFPLPPPPPALEACLPPHSAGAQLSLFKPLPPTSQYSSVRGHRDGHVQGLPEVSDVWTFCRRKGDGARRGSEEASSAEPRARGRRASWMPPGLVGSLDSGGQRGTTGGDGAGDDFSLLVSPFCVHSLVLSGLFPFSVPPKTIHPSLCSSAPSL